MTLFKQKGPILVILVIFGLLGDLQASPAKLCPNGSTDCIWNFLADRGLARVNRRPEALTDQPDKIR